jgi:hypothetical protein
MDVNTEVSQELKFKNDDFKHFKNVMARFWNGHIQWLRWSYKDGSTEYDIRFNSEGLKEFQMIINDVAKFADGSSAKIPEKIEKFRGRKIQLKDVEDVD